MALFLGGGRPLLAGIMTLVMVEPLTSSDPPEEVEAEQLNQQKKCLRRAYIDV